MHIGVAKVLYPVAGMVISMLQLLGVATVS